MEYTKNYHLPQWVKSDRIMMEDFNAMCGSIEGGLTAGKDALQSGLFRAAYNHLQLIAAEAVIPEQKGVFYQKLRGETPPANVSNMLAWDDYCWIARGTTTMNGESMKPYLVVEQPLAMVKDDLDACVPMTATFSPPVPGQMDQVILRGGYSGCDAKKCTFRMKFTNLSTGACEMDVTREAEFGSGNIALGQPALKDLILRFHGGIKYRLEVVPLEATVRGTFQLAIQTISSCHMSTVGTITQTVKDPEGGSDGLMLLRYGTYGEGGTLALDWDGKALTPHRVRTFTDEKGRTVHELEYRKGEAVPKSSTLRLTASCPVGGELCFYDWGVILI